MKDSLTDPYLDSMNFLNEACIEYPKAVSFGSGRPSEKFFHLKDVLINLTNHAQIFGGEDINAIGQYSLTKGIINNDIAELLKKDENINVHPDDIIMTDGAQEAMVIIAHALFGKKNDVLLVSEPSYIGFIGYAKLLGIEMYTIKRNETGIDLGDLESVICRLRNEHKNVTALYDVPDFHNPTGTYMSLNDRKQLLLLAETYDFFVIEDNPYGYFRYVKEKIPPLKALNKMKKVIYIGSFSKTIFPSIRIGYIIVDQVLHCGKKEVYLKDICKKVKSFTTVNTSGLLQTAVHLILKEHNFSLIKYCEDKVSFCKNNRDVMVKAAHRRFGTQFNLEEPKGGFFATLQLPFLFSQEMLMKGARDYGVIVCPMNMFCIDKENYKDQLRLSFSYNSPEEIEIGIERLYQLLTNL